jgi:hypothetical protein
MDSAGSSRINCKIIRGRCNIVVRFCSNLINGQVEAVHFSKLSPIKITAIISGLVLRIRNERCCAGSK